MSDARTPAAANPRRMALEALGKLRLAPGTGRADGYSNLIADAAIRRAGSALSDADRGLFSGLFFGVCERCLTIDYLLSRLSSRPVEKLDPEVLNLLRLGLWQLRWADRIPEHAAVNETVNLAKKYQKSFVNAILRSYLRQKDSLALPEGNGAEALSVRFSVSRDLCAEYLRVFGEEKTVRLLGCSFSAPGMTLRINTLRTGAEAFDEALRAEGFCAEPTPDAPAGRRITEGRGLPGVLRRGFCFVQDEASQLCAEVLGAVPGDRVLDVCACPGSKSFGAAMTMQNRGSILACDVHASKLPLITAGAKRLGITVITVRERDASQKHPGDAQKYTKVICDVPCSGFGVLAKKPEIRYKSLKEAAELPELQYRILESAAEAVCPGGVLVYSTCTVLPAENEDNVRRFLAEHAEFEAVPFAVGSRQAPEGLLSLYPDEGTDGFFLAKLHKKT